MHLGQIQGADESYLQALVRFPGLPAAPSWWKSFGRRMTAAAGLPTVASAFRLCLRQDGSVDRLFGAVFQARAEPQARQYFGGFSFLEGIEEDSVQLPGAAAEFDAWTGEFPQLRCRILPPPQLAAEGHWLACDFRVFKHLDGLAREAQSLGFSFGYQIHFRPFAPDPELVRRAGRNLIALQNVKGVPADIAADQERMFKSLRAATLLLEEIVAADRPEAAEWLTASLRRAFAADAARARLQAPSFDLAAGDCGADTALMMHSSLLYGDWSGDDLFVSQAAAESFRAALLSHRPAVDVPPSARPDSEAGPQPPRDQPPTPFPPDLELPVPSEAAGHIFISYRRSDLRRIAPILHQLAAEQLPIWYDRGISGGDEWDVVLERKIEQAAMMLVFLSQGVVESKYCRREIKFADALNKPLLVVVLEAADLRHGLKFLLMHMQQISIRDREFDSQLRGSIRRLLAGASEA
jgi:hypothetical protein